MKLVRDFNDFLIDILLEKEGTTSNGKREFHGVTELPFVMSNRLILLLENISHPIAKKLLKTNEDREDKKVTFVDLSDKENNKFSLINSNKAYDNIVDQFKGKHDISVMNVKLELDKLNVIDAVRTHDYWVKNRADVKIGSFINKVYPKEYKQGGNPGNDIESFVNSVVAYRKSLLDSDSRFKLVDGDDIVKYYNKDMYGVDTGTLAGSCMRYDTCSDYINFYAKNKGVKLLVLFSNNEHKKDKIIGRALVWELDKPSGRTYMDRIYTGDETDTQLFKQYAENKGWLFKKSQNMSSDELIVDTQNDNKEDYIKLKTVNGFITNDTYPYMDTLKWFNIDGGFLTNYEEIAANYSYNYYMLESTNGGYSYGGVDDEMIYVDYYDQSFDEEELIWCELGDDYRLSNDAQYIEDYHAYATEEWIEDNLIWSEYMDKFIENDKAVYSEYHEDYIPNDESIIVSVGFDYENMGYVKEDEDDYRLESESEEGGSVIKYVDKYSKEYYFDKYESKDYFIHAKIYNPGYPTTLVWKHKIWDKDKLISKNGVIYYIYDEKIKDNLTGKKRLWDK